MKKASLFLGFSTLLAATSIMASTFVGPELPVSPTPNGTIGNGFVYLLNFTSTAVKPGSNAGDVVKVNTDSLSTGWMSASSTICKEAKKINPAAIVTVNGQKVCWVSSPSLVKATYTLVAPGLIDPTTYQFTYTGTQDVLIQGDQFAYPPESGLAPTLVTSPGSVLVSYGTSGKSCPNSPGVFIATTTINDQCGNKKKVCYTGSYLTAVASSYPDLDPAYFDGSSLTPVLPSELVLNGATTKIFLSEVPCPATCPAV